MEWEIIYAGLVVFGAGIIRGYTGFGFAMICALGLAYVFPPAKITPLVLCIDFVASAWLFWTVRKDVDWKGLKLIVLGALFALPLGTLALAAVPANPMRILISLVIFLLSIALLRQKERRLSPGPTATAGVGICSGFLTGVAALGGPPVILFYFSSDRPVVVSRASMIAFFMMTEVMGIVSSISYGLVDARVMTLSLKLLIPLGMGIWIGNHLFGKFSNEAAFRKQVIYFLMAISLISMVKFSMAAGP